MKVLVALLPVCCSLLLAPRAAALEAITSYAVGNSQGGYVPGGAGFAFSPQIDISLTALGFNGIGLTNNPPYTVTLWGNGQALASVQINFGSRVLNQTRYEFIPGVPLLKGQTYYISAADTNDLWVGNIIQSTLPFQSFTIGTNIDYVGAAYGKNLAGGFPMDIIDTNTYYVAPNFQFVPGLTTNLIWASLSNNRWDIGISSNWFNQAVNSLDRYYNGVYVLFDDSPGVVTNIDISGIPVVPLVVTNKSSTNNFRIAGPGWISGRAVVVKDGTSTLTLSSVNDYAGDTIVLGGTLKIDRVNALGTADGPTIITNSGTLDLNGFKVDDEIIIVSGSGLGGAGAIVNNGPWAATNAIRNLVLAGNASVGGSNRVDLGGGGPAYVSTRGRALSLTKVGTNQLLIIGPIQVDPAFADIEVREGTVTFDSFGGTFGDPNRSLIVRSNAVLSFSNLSPIPLNKHLTLSNAATMFSEQGSNVLSGQVSLQGTTRVLVTSNAPNAALTFSGEASGPGTLIKQGDGPVVLTAKNSYTGSTLVQTGQLSLGLSGSISASANIVLDQGTTLDASRLTNATALVLGTNQALSGNGAVLGNLRAAPGSTVSPGTGIGVLSVSNDVVLEGTNFMQVQKGPITNDLLIVGGTLSYGGTLSLTNLSGKLVVGDRFKLFSAAAYTNAFTNVIPAVPSPGLGWNTNQLITNGIVTVVRTPPVITNLSFLSTNLIVAGTNGLPDTSYYVLTSTNLALPLTNWTRLVTNLFSPLGDFKFTNRFNPLVPEEYYLLEMP